MLVAYRSGTLWIRLIILALVILLVLAGWSAGNL